MGRAGKLPPAAALLLILSGTRGSHAFCPEKKFWTPKACSGTWDVYVPFPGWECRDCPSYSVQYVGNDGNRWDETCMCEAGFGVETSKDRCNDYKGNPDDFSRTWPPIHDEFTCKPCSETVMLCPGGTTSVVKGTPPGIVHFRRCVEGSEGCGSGYKLYHASQFHIQEETQIHMPVLVCQIYGQASSGGKDCKCPKNSHVVYSHGLYHDQLAWYFHLQPVFVDPSGNGKKYFGFCGCKDGFYRVTPTDYGSDCVPCGDDRYCKDGVVNLCPNGWKTVRVTPYTSASLLSECSVPPKCENYEFCDTSKPKTEKPCTNCPKGHRCNGGTQSFPCDEGTNSSGVGADMGVCRQCNVGTYTDAKGQEVCKPCELGKYSDRLGAAICQECPKGKYANETGMSACLTCSNNGEYQPETGNTTCIKCGAGYAPIVSTAPSLGVGNTNASLVCYRCGKGQKSLGNGESCEPCERNTYSNQEGQSICTPCGGDLITNATGKQSFADCICPAKRFLSGKDTCSPCGACLPNEYVVSPCGVGLADVKCAVCKSCDDKRSYVIPTGMCNGENTVSEQDCSPCRLEQYCGGSTRDTFKILSRCLSGTGSYDTSLCMGDPYSNPLEFECKGGEYQVLLLL